MERHSAFIQALERARASEKRRLRGPAGYMDDRLTERSVRMRTLAFGRWARMRGKDFAYTSKLLGLSSRTLAFWDAGWRESRLPANPLGRPAVESPAEKRSDVRCALNLLGPHTGVPSLQGMFPEMPRSELADLLWHYRKEYIIDNDVIVHTLQWKKTGTVWAMDFTKEPKPVDGKFRYILAVRDLAGYFCFMYMPSKRKTAKVVKDALRRLFAAYGVPLVIKTDNGSEFIARKVQAFLLKNRVTQLLTPPWTPEYNGSIEAGIGAQSTHAYHEAARRGYPEELTCDDCAAAPMRTNEIARPWGHNGPTPNEVWARRVPVTDAEREAFIRAVEETETELLKKEQIGRSDRKLDKRTEARIRRESIGRALVALGYLEIRRMRFTPPIRSKK